MKKSGFVVFLFLMVASCVLAMDDPIIVEANSGDRIKIFVWPDEYGPVLNLADGVANDDGFFSTTFFSLSDSNIKYQVVVYDSEGDMTHSETFEDYGIDDPLKVDCTYEDSCTMDVMSEGDVAAFNSDSEEVEEVVVENESVVVENESVDSEVFVDVEEDEGGSSIKLDVGVFFLYLIGGVLTHVPP